MVKYGEYFPVRSKYTDKYRFKYGYYPVHAFSMISCAHIAEMNTSAAYVVGAMESGLARGNLLVAIPISSRCEVIFTVLYGANALESRS
jgi:hypothetical protein